MEIPVIDHWIDLNSDEFKQVDDHAYLYRMTLRSIEVGAVVPDRAGYLWCNGRPIYVELNGKAVGLRHAAKATN